MGLPLTTWCQTVPQLTSVQGRYRKWLRLLLLPVRRKRPQPQPHRQRRCQLQLRVGHRSTRYAMYQWLALNTLRPRQNGRHFPDDTFKRIFLNENIRISTKNSLTVVPKGPINNIPALVQIMAWCRLGASHYLNQWWLVYRRIYASLGLNVLIARAVSL